MRVAILSSKSGWHTAALRLAFEQDGHGVEVLPYESLVARIGAPSKRGAALSGGGTSLFDVDAVLVRNIPAGSLEQIIFRVDALHWLEERGVRVMNSPGAIERCVDKFYTTALLREAGLPVPDTIVCERSADAVAAFRELGDVVVKPIFGSLGRGMARVSDSETAGRVFGALDQMQSVFYVQRAVDHGGRDLRAFVMGGRIVGAIERRAAAGEWRTNVSQGGVPHAITLSPEWERLALRAAAAVGAEYAGVDLLPEAGGRTYVLEVNSIPGWRGLQSATGIDVAHAIVQHVTDGVCLEPAS